MTTPAQHIESSFKGGQAVVYGVDFRHLDLEDDRILLDIETSLAMEARRSAESRVRAAMDRIMHHLREGSTLGPLSVLLILLMYTLVSPFLPQVFHDYVYHILH